MFWRFGFHNQSAIDVLLEKDTVSLQEILEEEEVLQECKAPNRKLIELFARCDEHCHAHNGRFEALRRISRDVSSLVNPAVLQQLLNYILEEPAEDLPMEKKYRYAMLASEVLSSDVAALNDAIISNENLLEDFAKFLDRPSPIDPIRAGYFCRLFSLLLQKKTGERQPNFIDLCLRHMDASAVIDLIVRIFNAAENQSAAHSVQIFEKLVSKFDPELPSEVHSNVAQCITEITNLVCSVEPLAQQRELVLERLRSKDICEATLAAALKAGPNHDSALYNALTVLVDLTQKHVQPPPNTIPLSGGSPSLASAQSLEPLVEAVLPHLKQIVSEINAPYVPAKPLGSRRWKIVEFLSVFAQIQSKALVDAYINLGVPKMLVYPLHNFLHYNVYDLFMRTVSGDPAVYGGLLAAFLRDAHLTDRIVEATKQNDAELESNDGVRRGYMGFLTLITSELEKLTDSDASMLSDESKAFLTAEIWQEYVKSSYKETRERDLKPLGGQKPVMPNESSTENDSVMYSGRSDSDSVQDQMTSSMPPDALVEEEDDEMLDLDGDDGDNDFQSAGIYSSTMDHPLDLDSDEEEGDADRVDAEYDEMMQNAHQYTFANFEEVQFAESVVAGFEENDSSDEESDRFLSTTTRGLPPRSNEEVTEAVSENDAAGAPISDGAAESETMSPEPAANFANFSDAEPAGEMEEVQTADKVETAEPANDGEQVQVSQSDAAEGPVELTPSDDAAGESSGDQPVAEISEGNKPEISVPVDDAPEAGVPEAGAPEAAVEQAQATSAGATEVDVPPAEVIEAAMDVVKSSESTDTPNSTGAPAADEPVVLESSDTALTNGPVQTSTDDAPDNSASVDKSEAAEADVPSSEAQQTEEVSTKKVEVEAPASDTMAVDSDVATTKSETEVTPPA